MENIDNAPFSFSCSVQVKDAAAGALVEDHEVVFIHLITVICGARVGFTIMDCEKIVEFSIIILRFIRVSYFKNFFNHGEWIVFKLSHF